MKLEERLSAITFAVVAHTHASGVPHRLRDFLMNKSRGLLFIGHPFFYSKDIKSFAEHYVNGKLIRSMKFPLAMRREIILYVKDVFATLYLTLRLKRRYDLYIGVDCLNAFVGLFLRKLGLVRMVIFYTLDYAIKRFDNRVLNHMYHLLDKLCAKHADFVWNVSDVISEARELKKAPKEYYAPQIIVPVGTDFDKINRKPVERIDKKIAYIGGMNPIFGPQLLFQALPELVRRIPDLKMVVTSTGPVEREQKLREFVDKCGLNSNVTFYGYEEDHSKLEEILTECSIGFAPYMPIPYSYKMFTDVTKPKVYMACGLPVVITKVPSIAKVIERCRAGIVINYDKDELIDATLKLLYDREFYKMSRNNAILLASKFKWSKIFDEALKPIVEEYHKRSVLRTARLKKD
ncbi:MAG: glycosyltransferase family 4 protein [Candidatus Geothermarchaeales archaeon]